MMNESILDAAFACDTAMRASLRAVAGALLQHAVSHLFAPTQYTIAERLARARAGLVDPEPAAIVDARVQAAWIALVLAEPGTMDRRAARTWRAVREQARFFGEAHAGTDTHVAAALARVVAARNTTQMHDAARMLARMPPRYDLALLDEYGIEVCDATSMTRPQRDELWEPAAGGAWLNHLGVKTRCRTDFGERARTALDAAYAALVPLTETTGADVVVDGDWDDGVAEESEEDVLMRVFEQDGELLDAVGRVRKYMLRRASAIACEPSPAGANACALHETTLDWINMLAMLHALAEGMQPNVAPWRGIRDVLRRLFSQLHWDLSLPSAEGPPGMFGLCVLLRAESAAQFHDGARMFAGIAPLYRDAPANTPPDFLGLLDCGEAWVSTSEDVDALRQLVREMSKGVAPGCDGAHGLKSVRE